MITNQNKFWALLFFLGVFFVFFLPAIDTDLGWHLRYGEHFFKTGHFLKTNQLTVLLANYSWPNSYTLYQILTFLIFKTTGLWGLSAGSALLFLISFLILFLLFQKNLFKTVISFLLIVPASMPVIHLGWRSQLFSFLNLILEFWFLKSYKKAFFLPLLFFFWVNLHGAFVLGLAVFLIFLLVQLLKLLYKKTGLQQFLLWTISFFLSFLATLINPYKLKVWWEAWHHLKVPMGKLIAEWVAPQPPYSWFIILIFLLSLILIYLEKRRTPRQAFLGLSLLMFFYLALSARRNLPFFFLNASLFINDTSFLKKWQGNLSFKGLIQAFIILIFFAGIFLQLPKTAIGNSSWQNYCQVRKSFAFPCKAVAFLQEEKVTGNFYNTYEWGGFLEWQLPKAKFFVDGRMPAWPTPSGKSPYTIYLETLQTQPGWQETLKKHKISYLFIQNGNALDLRLKNDPGQYPWKEIYRDGKGVIYEKQEDSWNRNIVR